MSITQSLSEIKSELKALIRRNSDRGFLPYGGCNRVCDAMIAIVEESKELADPQLTFDIQLFVLAEAVKMISHADTSSGAAVDAINCCLAGLEELGTSATDANRKYMLDAILKIIKSNKVFDGWEEYGYRLMRNAVPLVQDRKQADKVFELFPILGPMYGGEEYPDRYVITHNIIERLDGAEAAAQYRMEHLDVPEIRAISVERALAEGQYALAEKLCTEVFKREKSYRGPSRWAYYLERIYTEQANKDKLIDIVRLILLGGDSSYYARLKALYQSEGIWEQSRESILQELSKVYMPHEYAALLSKEREWARLLAVVQAHHLYIEGYGKQLARQYPAETYAVYEQSIWNNAAAATDRGKYRGVCRLIKSYFSAGAKDEAKLIIRNLIEKYPRRVAMVDELETLERKLAK